MQKKAFKRQQKQKKRIWMVKDQKRSFVGPHMYLSKLNPQSALRYSHDQECWPSLIMSRYLGGPAALGI